MVSIPKYISKVWYTTLAGAACPLILTTSSYYPSLLCLTTVNTWHTFSVLITHNFLALRRLCNSITDRLEGPRSPAFKHHTIITHIITQITPQVQHGHRVGGDTAPREDEQSHQRPSFGTNQRQRDSERRCVGQGTMASGHGSSLQGCYAARTRQG